MAKRRYTTNPLLTRKCSVDGCDMKHTARGLCAKHYERWRVYGSIDLSRAENGAPERFLRNLQGHKGVECVVWPFSVDRHGYGRIGCKQSLLPTRTAHRLICIWVHGDPPFPKAEAAHSCGNRRCVNPLHLRWASTLENNRERRVHGTMPMGEANPASKLSRANVAEILASDRSGPELAADFGVTRSTINKIRRGEIWAHKTNG